MRNDTLIKALVLDYSTSFEISATSLEKTTSTHIALPSTPIDIIKKVRTLEVVTFFFFGEDSCIIQVLKKFCIWAHCNQGLLDVRVMLDENFIAKCILSFDEKIYLWLD